MIGDNAKRCIIENSIPKGLFIRARLSLDGEPLKEDDSPMTNPDITQTNGLYTLSYQPSKMYKWGPYLILCDLFEGRKIRVSGYDDILGRIEKNDERSKRLKFLIEWTNLSKTKFEIAKEHFLMQIPFTFDIDKYYKMILKKEHKRKGLVFRNNLEEEMQRDRFYSTHVKYEE